MNQQVFGFLVDHVYIKKTLMTEFFINVTVESIYFSDSDALRVLIEQKNVNCDTLHKIQYVQAIKKNVVILGFLVV